MDGVLAKQKKSEINKDALKNDIVISDINKSMLEVGRQRAKNKGIQEGLSLMYLLLLLYKVHQKGSDVEQNWSAYNGSLAEINMARIPYNMIRILELYKRWLIFLNKSY